MSKDIIVAVFKDAEGKPAQTINFMRMGKLG
jgi:hypothetical protein